MKRLFKHGDNLYLILREIPKHNIEEESIANKKMLKLWVDYLNGNHVLLHEGKYLICETVQDAVVIEE